MSYISILGKTTDETKDGYSILLKTEEKSWVGSEPGGTSKVLKTKAGPYVYKNIPDIGTYCNDADGNVVCFLKNLEPDNAKARDLGQGHAHETGRPIDWLIDSL